MIDAVPASNYSAGEQKPHRAHNCGTRAAKNASVQSDQDLRRKPPFFGLPSEVTFCNQCVISNQRPNSAVEYQHRRDTPKSTIKFNSSGTCDACQAAEQKKAIDWSTRERELLELCDRHRRSDGHYDCLVPGSGVKTVSLLLTSSSTNTA